MSLMFSLRPLLYGSPICVFIFFVGAVFIWLFSVLLFGGFLMHVTFDLCLVQKPGGGTGISAVLPSDVLLSVVFEGLNK